MDAVAVTSCFSSPTSPTESSVPSRIAVLLDQALAQSQLAGDRSVKRRIRQRLQRQVEESKMLIFQMFPRLFLPLLCDLCAQEAQLFSQ